MAQQAQAAGSAKPPGVTPLLPAEALQAERHLDQLQQLSEAAGLLRAHPDYQAPGRLIGAIRAVLQAQAGSDGLKPLH